MIEAAIRLGLLLLLATWCFMIVAPFVLPIMWGIIIAVAVFPLFAKLKSALGGRNKLAATVYTLIAVGLLITPTLMISGSLVDTAQVLVDKYEQGTLTVPPPDESVKDWPVIGEKVSEIWTQALNNLDTTVDKYRPQLKQVSEKIVAIATSTAVTVLIFIA